MDVLLRFMHKTAQFHQANVSLSAPIPNSEIQQQEHVYPNVHQAILVTSQEMALQQALTFAPKYALNQPNTVTPSQDCVWLESTVRVHTSMPMTSQDNVSLNALQAKIFGVMQASSIVY